MSEKRSYWEGHVKEQERSGEKLSEYAERHRLKTATLSYWRTKLKREGSKGEFIPLNPVPEARLELLLRNGILVRLPTGFRAEEVKRLVEAIEC